MSKLVLNGDTSGSVTLDAPAVSGTTTLTLPTTSGTLIVNSGSQTIEFADGSASTPSITNSGDTNTGMFFPAADTIAFAEGGAEAMRLDSSGNVLVGTTTPIFTGKLNAYTASADQWAGVFENATVNYDTLIVQNHATSGNNRFIGFATEAAYTERGYIYYDRAVGQTKLSATSDYRAKDIVGDTTGALEKVSLMKVKNAKLKWAEGEAYPMFIAHELQEVASWAVSGEKDAVDEDGNPQYQTVSYESLVATLTAAIKEQQAIIETLKSDIAELKAKVNV